MGNQVSLVPKVSYEDIQMVVYRNTHVPHTTLIINTLPASLQHCLIKTTVDIRYEEQIVNSMLHKNRDIMIIVYGKNSNDITILHKYDQLVKLGFTNVHIYTGGIFEWMLLYEIYGKELFKITRYEIDILRYRPKSVILAAMAGGGGGGAGAYIEDGNHIRDHHNEDVRVDIPSSSVVNDTVSAADEDDDDSGGRIQSGLKWLFGS
jgi:rhodanese-related sulfurtransferase